MMESGQISTNCFVRLKDYLGNNVQGRKILIVLDISDIQPGFERIGSPESIDKVGGNAASNPAAPAVSSSIKPFSNQPVQSVNKQQPQPSYLPRQNDVKPPMSSYSNSSSTSNSSFTANRAPVVREDPNIRVSDIQSLNPYSGGRWTIKARVTNRAPIKNWSNARGQGKLCSFELLDAKGGEIRATMFNDAVDTFYDRLTPGSVFYFSNGKIKMANRKFSSIDNDYEITFDHTADITPAPEDTSIYQVHYNFKKINIIETLQAESTIDVIGVVSKLGPLQELTSKAGKNFYKKDFHIIDDTFHEIKVTMWNEMAQNEAEHAKWEHNVLAIKGCRVSEFNGKTIGTFSSTSFNLNPPIKEAGELLHWYQSNGGNQVQPVKSLSTNQGGGLGGSSMGTFQERSSLEMIKLQKLGLGLKPDYITVKGTVSYIKHENDVWYQACPKCSKKVIPDVANNFNCHKCQTVYQTCENRYIMSLVIQDSTGSSWVSCFNEQGKLILNDKSADEMAEIKESNSVMYEACFRQALFQKYLFRLRIKAEPHQDELRIKSQVFHIEKLNYAKESKDLLDMIAKY